MIDPKKGGPAFPVECNFTADGPSGMQTGNSAGWWTGMTLRDYFAAKAMQALLQQRRYDDQSANSLADLSGSAYDIADAMLTERAR